MRTSAKQIALGGILAALAVVIMSLGGLIPIATYTIPMLCLILQFVVLQLCGRRIAWAWYGAVSILSMLLGPDKEAAAVFVFLGYYPILKPWIDQRKLSVLWKLVLFNAAIFAMYSVLIYVFGLADLMAEFEELGTVLTIVTLVLGNATLFMMDILLTLLEKRKIYG